jgi:hypothetical protein
VHLRYALSPTAVSPTDTLARVADEPWIVAGDGYVLFGSPLDTAATGFPVTAEFVPWLARTILDRLAPAGGPAATAVPGARIAVLHGADSLELVGERRLASRDSITLPQRTGVYFWTQGARRIGAVVVNGEAQESDLRRATEREVRAAFAPAPVRARERVSAFVNDVYGSALRRPVAAVLIGLALGLLIVETMLTRAHTRRLDVARPRRREAA